MIEKIKEAMENSGIPEIYLGRLDLAFADIFVPGLQLAYHESSCQDVEIGSDCFIGKSHGAAEFRGIPGLAVIMGKHGPEASHSCRSDGNAEMRDILGQEGADEAFPPDHAVFVRVGQE